MEHRSTPSNSLPSLCDWFLVRKVFFRHIMVSDYECLSFNRERVEWERSFFKSRLIPMILSMKAVYLDAMMLWINRLPRGIAFSPMHRKKAFLFWSSTKWSAKWVFLQSLQQPQPSPLLFTKGLILLLWKRTFMFSLQCLVDIQWMFPESSAIIFLLPIFLPSIHCRHHPHQEQEQEQE